MARGCPSLHHLFFANDSIPFCRSKMSGWAYIQGLLATYEEAFGQFLNRQKTSIFFSADTKKETREMILATTEVTSCSNQAKYLGLPSTMCKSKYKTFGELKDKV